MVFSWSIFDSPQKNKYVAGNGYPLVNVYVTNWKDPPFYSWVNPRTVYGHVPVRKLLSCPEGPIKITILLVEPH